MALGGGGGGKASPDAVKAGEAFIDVWVNDTRFMRGLDAISNRVKKFGAGLSKFGLGIGAAGVAGLVPVMKAVEDINDIARQGSIADAFGLTSEQFTGIAGVAKSVGEGTREFIESMVTLGKVSAEGAAGKGEVAAQFFKDLNLNAKEFVNLRADEKFFQFFEAVQKVEDPLKKVRLLMVAFGEDGGKFLLPLLAKTPAQLREMAGGFAVATDDMQAAQAAQATYIEATTAISKAWRAVVVALAPTIKEFMSILGKSIQPLAAFIKENKGVVATVAIVVGALTGLGAVFAVAGIAITGFVATLILLKTVIIGVIGLMTSPFLLAITGITTAIGGLILAHDQFSGKSETIADEAVQAWDSIKNTAILSYEGIVAAISKGDLSTAFEIAWTGIKLVWNEGLLFLTKQWNKFKGVFVDGWHDMVAGIKIAFWEAIAWVMRQFSKAVTFVTKNAADLLDAVGATDTARAVRSVTGFTDEEINAGRDAIINEIKARRAERQKASDEARAADVKDLTITIDALTEKLHSLVAIAKDDGRVEGNPLIGPALGTFLRQIQEHGFLWHNQGKEIQNTLGKAVRGAFSSRNYQGAFGIASAEKIQKDQLNTQKDMKDLLASIDGKVGRPVFD